MKVIGFSIGHDRGATLIIDGEVKVSISKERLSRIKSDSDFQDGTIPMASIDYCLEVEGLTYEDIDLYVYNCTMFDNIEEQFEKTLNLPKEKLKYIPHHLAHAYSTYYSSDFNESIVVVADAMGSLVQKGNKAWEWFSKGYNLEDTSEKDFDWAEGITIYEVKNNEFNEIYKKWIKFEFPWEQEGEQISVGGYYGMGTYQLVRDLKSNTWKAGKLMGLASYAETDYVNSIPRQTYRDGNDVFIPSMYFRPEVTMKDDFQLKANVAGVYQREQEQISLGICGIGRDLSDVDNICVAGGSFLNCNTNELIIKSKMFKNQYFVPPADDSGIPLGCAWYGYLTLNPSFKNDSKKWQTPYLGKTYGDDEIKTEIENTDGIGYVHFDDFNQLTGQVAEYLNQHKVIGWYQGGSETGPRALGNRSILANPKYGWMTNYVNEIKEREWYRPFAPSVLFEEQSKVFDLDTYSPYMLVTAQVNSDWRSRIPAVTHIDGTSRFQSVTRDSNPRYHKLISDFHKLSGIPLVLNTSFNGPSEPIVETPRNAIDTFLRQGLHYLIMGNYLVFRK